MNKTKARKRLNSLIKSLNSKNNDTIKKFFLFYFFFNYSAYSYYYPINIQPQSILIQNVLPGDAFIQHLFECIAQSFNHIKLSETDLFHGHLIKTENDLIIIFHAKEYPDDLYWWNKEKSGYTTKSPEYYERNFLWSRNKNTIWLLKAKPGDKDYGLFLKLIIPENFIESEDIEMAIRAYTVQQDYFGKKVYDIYTYSDK